jgi:hypothetical protein
MRIVERAASVRCVIILKKRLVYLKTRDLVNRFRQHNLNMSYTPYPPDSMGALQYINQNPLFLQNQAQHTIYNLTPQDGEEFQTVSFAERVAQVPNSKFVYAPKNNLRKVRNGQMPTNGIWPEGFLQSGGLDPAAQKPTAAPAMARWYNSSSGYAVPHQHHLPPKPGFKVVTYVNQRAQDPVVKAMGIPQLNYGSVGTPAWGRISAPQVYVPLSAEEMAANPRGYVLSQDNYQRIGAPF